MEDLSRLIIEPCGDRALRAVFSDAGRSDTTERVMRLCEAARAAALPGIVETVPCDGGIFVLYRPEMMNWEGLGKRLQQLSELPVMLTPMPKRRILRLPVCYGARFAPGFASMEKALQMDRETIIHLHSKGSYTVKMMGKMPGFPYLEGLDSTLADCGTMGVRRRVPAGSVIINNGKTCIYPFSYSAEGFVIGATPLDLFDVRRPFPSLLSAGDKLEFYPISMFEWYDIKRAVSEGTYIPDLRDAETGELIRDLPAETVRQSSSAAGFSLLIEEPGPATTVQDLGRFNALAQGVTESGAADRASLRRANRILGNADDAAGLELTASGMSFKVKGNGTAAFSGADMDVKKNGMPVPLNQAVTLCDGDLVTMGEAKNACRLYMAVAGGIDVPVILGSRSTWTAYGIGGYYGRALQKGDEIGCFGFSGGRPFRIPEDERTDRILRRLETTPIRFIPSNAEAFSAADRRTLTQGTYRLANHSDRDFCLLEGPALNAPEKRTNPQVIPAGSIIIAADGKPFIVLADHPTDSRSQVIGTVIHADLWSLAQLLTGDEICFRPCMMSEALDDWKE